MLNVKSHMGWDSGHFGGIVSSRKWVSEQSAIATIWQILLQNIPYFTVSF